MSQLTLGDLFLVFDNMIEVRMDTIRRMICASIL